MTAVHDSVPAGKLCDETFTEKNHGFGSELFFKYLPTCIMDHFFSRGASPLSSPPPPSIARARSSGRYMKEL
jgi:hypothetical protein